LFFRKGGHLISKDDPSSAIELKEGRQKVFFRAGGEWCYLQTPESFTLENKVPVVIHHHGAGGYVKKKKADWLGSKPKAAIMQAVAEGSGCAIAGSHACGNHWGSPCSVTANEALLSVLDICPGLDTKRLGLLGGGIGGALIWNSVLGPFKERVKLVAVLQAVASLEAIIREQRFKKVCLKAHGIPKNTGDDMAIGTILPCDPLPGLKKLDGKTGLPKTAIYHGAKDKFIPAHSHAIPLAEALKEAGGEAELFLFPERGHDIYAMGKQIERWLKDFFSAL
jgi:acetyl esterase/lipase